MTFQEPPRKRLHNGLVKLRAAAEKPVVDLANDSDKELSSSSKRAKSSSLGPGHKTSLPYISSRPSSTFDSKSRLSTPSNEVFVTKSSRQPLFKSPSWQDKKTLHQRHGAQSTTPTPAFTDRKQGEGSDFSRFSTKSKATSTSKLIDSPSNGVKNEKLDRLYESERSEPTSKALVTDDVQGNRDIVKERSKTDSRLPEAGKVLAVAKPSKKESSTRTQHQPPQSNLPRPSVSRASKQSDRGESPASARNPNPHTRLSKPSNPSYSTLKKSERTISPTARSITSNKTPSKPTIVVEINKPRDRYPESSKSASPTLLDVFRQPLLRSDADRTKSIRLKGAKRNREAYLLAELKKDTSIARSRASTVEEVFGSHGLSKHYNDIVTIDQRRSLAQPKAKKVKRSKVKLDLGIPPAASIFNPAGVIPPAEQAKRLLDARFEDLSGRPLTFFNDRNDRQIDGKFQFIDSYIHKGGGLKTQLAPPDFGCQCSRQCDPTDLMCRCLQTQDEQKLVPYTRRQDGLVVLNPDIIDSIGTPQEIYECNDACNCSPDCFNRVVEKGRTIPLQIFMTRRCGFGIRSPRPIKKGQFIDVYLGELLTTKAIEDYENASTEKSSSYVFSLDFFGPVGPASYHVQGLHFGSPTRFINHSCNPNTRIFTVMMNHADQKIYKLAYFAIRDIPAMKEITFDYSPETAHEEPLIPTPGEEDEDVVRCLCGERNCRGRVWPKRQITRRKGRGWAGA